MGLWGGDVLSSLVELDGRRPAAAKGHLVPAADGSAMRNQSQEVSRNTCSCCHLRLRIKYCLKLTSTVPEAQNSAFLYGFCVIYSYTHT